MKNVPFTPLTDGPASATVFRCALCGERFTHGVQACGSCPLSAGCDQVSCPGCGHSFPRRSRLADWVGRLLRIREERR